VGARNGSAVAFVKDMADVKDMPGTIMKVVPAGSNPPLDPSSQIPEFPSVSEEVVIQAMVWCHSESFLVR